MIFRKKTPPSLPQGTLELIVDTLTVIHSGSLAYEAFASQQAVQEAALIRKRFNDLKKQGVPGLGAVRQAKLEWLHRLLS